MKNTLNVILAVVLFCSVAFAGDMGNGGRTGDDPTDTTVTGDMGNGGRPGNITGSTGMSLDTVIVAAIEQYLGLGF